jgi:hypothetical protein
MAMQMAYDIALFLQALTRLIEWLYLRLCGRSWQRPGGVLGALIAFVMLAVDALAALGQIDSQALVVA